MSQRRSISFGENELDLLEFFDTNGKSYIAKQALRFYRDNKENVLTEGMVKLLKAMNTNDSTQKQQIPNFISKLKK
ncbi:MAG TPA: hypothetical protein GX708_22800 [Gallicola sp.]|nr:hypothetical protein [Gallicola sp.]